MIIVHVSAECYPVAKVGGLGDVVGALPKYQQAEGHTAIVAMPYYEKPYVKEHSFDVVFESTAYLGGEPFFFQVLKETTEHLGFSLHLIKIPGLLDRAEVYGHADETEQFVSFQIAVLEWLKHFGQKPDIIHCHDYHAGLIPFMMSHSGRYKKLQGTPSVLTIHNAEYQGWFGWEKFHYLPAIDTLKQGMLDWGGCINPLATAVKSCWAYTTVSPSYLTELQHHSNGLESLFYMEEDKGIGILNGIDTAVWNPNTDSMIATNYTVENISKGKLENKKVLCARFGFSQTKPLFAFIGRLVGEKGADLLPNTVRKVLNETNGKASILVLGSGEKWIEQELLSLKEEFPKNYNVFVGYDEKLSHQIYSGADCLIMPSRVEPCGLNQLYSLRYGTLPVVRRTGGLKDTVIDISEPNGYGINFEHASVDDLAEAILRGIEISSNSKVLRLLRKQMMELDFSWNRSALEYIKLYNSLNPNV